MGMQRVIVSMPDELVAAVGRLAVVEERSRSAVIRRLVQAFVKQQEAFVPGVATVPNLDEVRHGPLDGHEFKPQAGNQLRCECGLRKADHPRERT